MNLTIEPGFAAGTVTAPPSKSMAHRQLICAALSRRPCRVENLAWSEDILATVDCLRALGASVACQEDAAEVDGAAFLTGEGPLTLPCRSSGSTLRFLIPLALTTGRPVTFTGTERLFTRPLSVYESLCKRQKLRFEPGAEHLTVEGLLRPGEYEIPGNVSSQFVTGLLLALPLLAEPSELRLLPPVESRPYVSMSLGVLRDYGVRIVSIGEDRFHIPGKQKFRPHRVKVEGDWSNAAFLEALNTLGSRVKIKGLVETSTQGDKICRDWFRRLAKGKTELSLADNPDLAPILMTLAAALHGGVFTNTARLQQKESNRGEAMARELRKFGAEVLVDEDRIWVADTRLFRPAEPLDSNGDHRIAMALAVLCTMYGGTIREAEAVQKSWPDFFDVLKELGLSVEPENAEAQDESGI